MFDCTAQSAIPEADCEAIVALYNSTGGDAWTDNTGWLTAPDPCDWFGVVCAGGSVVELALRTNNLMGPVPVELANLTAIESLNFTFNYLNGAIPPQLGSLTSLRYLGFFGNDLTGSIPAELGGLTALQFLILDGNQPDWDDPTRAWEPGQPLEPTARRESTVRTHPRLSRRAHQPDQPSAGGKSAHRAHSPGAWQSGQPDHAATGLEPAFRAPPGRTGLAREPHVLHARVQPVFGSGTHPRSRGRGARGVLGMSLHGKYRRPRALHARYTPLPRRGSGRRRVHLRTPPRTGLRRGWTA